MGGKSFFFWKRLDRLWGQITLQKRGGGGGIVSGVRRPGHDFDHSSHVVPNFYIKLLSYLAFNDTFTPTNVFTTFTRRIYLNFCLVLWMHHVNLSHHTEYYPLNSCWDKLRNRLLNRKKQVRQRTYNVILRRSRVTIIVLESIEYYILCVVSVILT
jgi:hypothetical protein